MKSPLVWNNHSGHGLLDNARLEEVIDVESGSPDHLPEDFLF